ncbi:MAG TPA: glycosyltransferase family 1 protein [Dehalococcoidia bacterium]|nr:glycosyltransferase family 1 protein [Dehalococcoidia bacterium]
MNSETNKLRIAMLSVHSCPVGNLGAKDTGGMSVYIRELARELCHQGHTVDVFTRVHDPADPQIIDLGEGARLIHIKAGQEMDIHKLALYSYLPDFACNMERYRKDNDLEYDLVFSHYWLSCWVGKYLQIWWHVPHVTMFHTMGAIKNGIGIGEEEPELRIVTEREAVQDSHRIIASTEREKEDIIRYYGAIPDKIGVVPCGVNRELFQIMDKQEARLKLDLDDEKILLFVGRIDPLKGVEQLLKAVSRLKDTANPRLIIIGGDDDDNDAIKRLKEITEEMDLIDRVAFKGMIKHKELPLYYNAADVTVVPSYYESFGLVALESLACGIPVVAADVGDMRNIIRQGETGYVLPHNNPEGLADKISTILSGTGNIKAAPVIRESIKRYDWSNIAGAIARELYKVSRQQMTAVA